MCVSVCVSVDFYRCNSIAFFRVRTAIAGHKKGNSNAVIRHNTYKIDVTKLSDVNYLFFYIIYSLHKPARNEACHDQRGGDYMRQITLYID